MEEMQARVERNEKEMMTEMQVRIQSSFFMAAIWSFAIIGVIATVFIHLKA